MPGRISMGAEYTTEGTGRGGCARNADTSRVARTHVSPNVIPSPTMSPPSTVRTSNATHSRHSRSPDADGLRPLRDLPFEGRAGSEPARPLDFGGEALERVRLETD